MMQEYMFQVKMYTEYFLKIALSNKVSYFYSLVLPGIMLYLQLSVQNLEMETVRVISTSWLAYMIINHALTYTFKVSFLREQGYLKQYHTLVKDISVFLVSQGLAGLLNLIGSSLIMILLASFMSDLSFIIFAVESFLVILLVYPPLVFLFSFFLSFRMRHQTIIVIRNIASSVLMFLTFAMQSIVPTNINIIIRLLNPLNLTMMLYRVIASMDFLNFGLHILPVLLLYSLIGIVSMKQVAILPVEGL
jgi:hypothetical protein